MASRAEVNSTAIADVKSGKIKEARASWWGFDKTDSTKALQAAINSGAKRLIVDKMASPWVVTPIHVAGDLEIIFEKGVIVEAKKGEFHALNDALFNIISKDKVTLTGYGATLRMRRDDYDAEPYKKAEWRNVLNILSSSNVKIYGLTLSESGGDGIYLGTATREVPNKNIHIKDVICDKNYRQGISVISAEHLLIEDTLMSNTAGTPPKAGIDFEPNHFTDSIIDCVMKNCVSENNEGVGYALALVFLNGKSPDVSIRLENCISRGSNSQSFFLKLSNADPSGPVKGLIEVLDCTFAEALGTSIEISQMDAAGCDLKFKKCRIEPSQKGDLSAPHVLLRTDVESQGAMGGIEFIDCVIKDDTTRPITRFDDWAGGTQLLDFSGALKIQRKDGESLYSFDQKWADSLKKNSPYKWIAQDDVGEKSFVPVVKTEKLKRVPVLRKSGIFQIYAHKYDEVAITLNFLQIGKYASRALKIKALSPSGKALSLGELELNEEKVFRFLAPETGLYQIPFQSGLNKMRMTASNRPATFYGKKGVVHFYQTATDLFFYVPAGCKEFGVKIYGENSEGVAATIVDPTGKERWADPAITLPKQFAAKPTAEEMGKVWKLKLRKSKGVILEDFYVELQGIPPFFAISPEGLLKPVKTPSK